MEMIWIVAGLALIGAIFVVLWKRDRADTHDYLVDGLPTSGEQRVQVDMQYMSKGCEQITISRPVFLALQEQLAQQIVGLDGLIHALMITLLIRGHALIEGVPGLAKTKTVATLAQALDLSFRRIQFTADMLPGDITGVEIYNQQEKKFEVQYGPVFAHIILADEINRATPKVQSALLEAMQEHQVTIGNETLPLPDPFFVLATQNPIEQEGTYHLPEAQVDRFAVKIIVTYPSLAQEEKMLQLLEKNIIEIRPVLDATSLLDAQQEVAATIISDELKQYIVRIVDATRKSPWLQYGASPRASLTLMQASKALAWLGGREEVTHEDIHRVVLLVLRHRVIPTYEAQIAKKSVDELLVEIVGAVSLT